MPKLLRRFVAPLFRAAPSLLLLAVPVYAEQPRDSVVKIEVTNRRPSLTRPWSKQSPSKSSGSGVMIADGRLLTNAHVVKHASQIEVQPNGSSTKHAARVVAVAPSMDLALLEFEDPTVAETIPPVEINPALPELRQDVTVLGYPMGGDELSITEGIVSRIEFTRYYYSAMGLRIQIDAALNSGNSGGPAISNNKLVGLVFSKIEEADNIGYLIPSEEIITFLADIKDGHYDGKATTSGKITVQRLESPTLRRRLGLDAETTGIMVQSAEDVPNGSLRVWDVVTHIGPHAIDNQGFVRVNGSLRLVFSYYSDKLATADGIPLTVVRNGETIPITAPVARGDHELLKPLMHDYPDYFIWGPIVFTTAYSELIYASRGKMMTYMMAVESPLLGRLRDRPAFEGEEIVIIPIRLFPHATSRGYRSVAMATVSSVDGHKVKSLAHLAELLRDASGEFVEIHLGGNYPKLVFDREAAEEATEEILTDEGIRRRGSKEILDIWNAKPADLPKTEPVANTEAAPAKAS